MPKAQLLNECAGQWEGTAGTDNSASHPIQVHLGKHPVPLPGLVDIFILIVLFITCICVCVCSQRTALGVIPWVLSTFLLMSLNVQKQKGGFYVLISRGFIQ